MLIEIKKVLKKGIGILLVIILVGVGVTKFKDNKKKKDFLYHDHDSIVAKYGEEGELSKKNLIQIKRLFGNHIEKFESKNYTAREAKMAGFSDEGIFREYSRDAILEAYGDINKELDGEILDQIGRALVFNIYDFKEKGYTVKEARLAGFNDEGIFTVYKRDAIVEAYGEGLDYRILAQIRRASSCNIYNFKGKGYTAKEAKMAGFDNEEIFRAYSRDAIVEAYGEGLDYRILAQIRRASSCNIYNFKGKGYTAKEAKMAGFDNEEIFGEYSRDAIVEAYGDINKELNCGILYQIGRACYFDIYDFKEKGYTVKEARLAEFKDEGIFRAYKRDAIVEAYGDRLGELDCATLHKIKTALLDNILCFGEKGYTIKEARLAGFKDEEIFRAYKRDAIVEAYGDHLGELDCATLHKIKTVLLDNILYFAEKGYTIKEAKMAGFDNEEVFLGYDRNAIVEAYGDDGILNAETLCEIKTALGEYCKEYDMSEINIVRLFHSKGYTEEEARVAGFSNDEISRTYM